MWEKRKKLNLLVVQKYQPEKKLKRIFNKAYADNLSLTQFEIYDENPRNG
ncbi:hypothetical protein GCM10020331_056400 [Ectobacillus funiculus]